jgi:hypothetical protein
MTLKIVFLMSAWAALSFGIPGLLVPEMLTGIYGVTNMSAHEVLLTRAGAGSWIALGVMSWFMRSAGPSTERDGIVLGMIIAYASSFVMTLLGILNNVHTGIGSVTVAIDLVLTLSFAYFRFIKRDI